MYFFQNYFPLSETALDVFFCFVSRCLILKCTVILLKVYFNGVPAFRCRRCRHSPMLSIIFIYCFLHGIGVATDMRVKEYSSLCIRALFFSTHSSEYLFARMQLTRYPNNVEGLRLDGTVLYVLPMDIFLDHISMTGDCIYIFLHLNFLRHFSADVKVTLILLLFLVRRNRV